MQHKLLIANWKANPATLAEAEHLFHEEMKAAKKHPDVTVVLCAPFVYMPRFGSHAAVSLGAQDVFWEGGAHTGQISTSMLKTFSVSHVLVGHSERREVGDMDEIINKKLHAVLAAGMTPILLIGEPEQGPARSDYLIDQLTRDLENVSADDAKKILFCYEPVWAIGKLAATSEYTLDAIHEMQSILNKMYGFKPSMLYGGSVNEHNVADFFRHEEIVGGVVGGASLRPDEFARMIEIVAKL